MPILEGESKLRGQVPVSRGRGYEIDQRARMPHSQRLLLLEPRTSVPFITVTMTAGGHQEPGAPKVSSRGYRGLQSGLCGHSSQINPIWCVWQRAEHILLGQGFPIWSSGKNIDGLGVAKDRAGKHCARARIPHH